MSAIEGRRRSDAKDSPAFDVEVGLVEQRVAPSNIMLSLSLFNSGLFPVLNHVYQSASRLLDKSVG